MSLPASHSSQALPLLPNLPEPMWIKDREGRFLAVNEAWCQFMGRSATDILGRTAFEFMPQAIAKHLAQQDEEVLRSGTPLHYEEWMTNADQHPREFDTIKSPWVAADGTILGTVGIAHDISQRKQAERLQTLSVEILAILNDPQALHQATQRILGAVKKAIGLDAVGIRLREGDDFPYSAAEGFSHGFLQAENSLAMRTAEGEFCRDENGQLRLECTCGLVLSGKTDPSHPQFTSGGSAWTNDAKLSLHILREEDPRLNPRNRCTHEGYQSVALIPIRVEQRIIGLLQLNDRRKNCFTLELVHFFEGVAASFGVALLRIKEHLALQEREERLELALKGGNLGLWDLDLRTRETITNDRLLEMLGYSPADRGTKLAWWDTAIHPEDRDSIRKALEDHLARKTDRFEAEYRLRTRTGDYRWVMAKGGITQCGRDGKACRMVGTMLDITERKQTEAVLLRLNRELRAISACNQALVRATDEQSLLEDICRIVCRVAGYRMAWVGYAQQDAEQTIKPITWAGAEEGYLSQIKIVWSETPHGQGPAGACIRNRQPCHIADFSTDADAIPWRAAAQQHGYQSCIALPLLDEHHQAFGAFIVYSAQRNAFTAEEVRLLDELASDLAFGIMNLRARAERNQAAVALQTSEAQHRTILRTAMEGFWQVDMQGRIEEVNEALCRMSGYHEAELVGKLITDLDATETAATTAERLRRIAEKGELRFEVQHRRKDGRVIDLEASAQYRPAEQKVVVFFRDITERKQAQEALQANERNLRSLLDTIPESAFMMRPNGEILAANETFAARLNARPEACQGRNVLEFLPAEIRPRRQQWITEVLGEGKTKVYEDQRHDRWMVHTITPILGSNGGTERLVVFAMDITERVQAEQQIRKLSQAVEQSPASILITDPLGTIEYVNPQFTQATGYGQEEVRGRNPRLLKGDKTSEAEYRHLWQTITQGQTWRGEFHNRKKSGEFFWESALIAPIVDGRGSITHFMAIKEDITHRKLLEEQLRQAQKLESIGQLAGGVAHDFNNILAATMMHLSFLQQDTGLGAETQEILAELMAEAKRAANLTRQLLMFSRRSVLQIEALDLNEVVANLLKMLGRLIGEHIVVLFKRQEGLPTVEADAGMIEQVLMNLAVNARDAMAIGGTLSIAIETVAVDAARATANPDARAGAYVCLSVSDTGCGMDEATQKRIFDPFFTTKAVGKGTGLGLATVHGIIALHKGWVEVESRLNQGTTFRIYLPATTKASLRPASESELPQPVTGQGTLLVVEDERSVRQAVSAALRKLGYQVFAAANGQEAMQLWKRHRQEISLLLSDMVMPEGMSGMDLANRLQAENPHLKVIISSGYNTESIVLRHAQEAGMIYLPKPFNIELLSQTVRKCLEND